MNDHLGCWKLTKQCMMLAWMYQIESIDLRVIWCSGNLNQDAGSDRLAQTKLGDWGLSLRACSALSSIGLATIEKKLEGP